MPTSSENPTSKPNTISAAATVIATVQPGGLPRRPKCHSRGFPRIRAKKTAVRT